jgi:O-acetyl-ADP-ribose deacetylase (regulator of RNase III)
MKYKEIEGDLIKLAQKGIFDVIGHGCNCMSNMGAGIAPQMAQAFGCNMFPMELWGPSIDKLGNIDYQTISIAIGTNEFDILDHDLTVVNIYQQYRYGKNHPDGVYKPFDYEAFTVCMRKINHQFKGKKIGFPQIGAGLASGDWNRIKTIIQTELKDCEVTVVIYKK